MISSNEAKTSRRKRNAEVANLVRFAFTGGIAAACNVGSRMLLSTRMAYGAAVALAYLVGMVVAFLLARALVFEASEQPWRRELVKFATVNVVSFAQVWFVSVGLARLLFPALNFRWHSDSIAHMIGVASPLLFSYYAHKHFTFRRPATLKNPEEPTLVGE